MINWLPFFQILCCHRPGYGLALPYGAAVSHPGQDQLHRILYMVPPPEGHPIGMSALAEEWIATESAA